MEGENPPLRCGQCGMEIEESEPFTWAPASSNVKDGTEAIDLVIVHRHCLAERAKTQNLTKTSTR